MLAAFSLEGARVSRVSVGLINRTFRVERRGVVVCVQRLHPVFAPEVNLDIEAVTDHVAARGLVTPRLVRALDGRAWVEHDGGIWRALSWIEGAIVERVTVPALAREAAAHVARFHRAVADLDHAFHFTRPGAHDTAAHLASLRRALGAHRDHPDFDAVRAVADAILARAERLPTAPDPQPRIVHGDLKISNVVFDPGLASAIALVDLDTLARETIGVELGDALRSWCNPAGEERDGWVDLAVFGEAMAGYASEATLAPDEMRAIVPGLERIALELATRFCTDALEEKYFAWSPSRFATRSEHARARARSQLALARDVAAKRGELERIVTEAFG